MERRRKKMHSGQSIVISTNANSPSCCYGESMQYCQRKVSSTKRSSPAPDLSHEGLLHTSCTCMHHEKSITISIILAQDYSISIDNQRIFKSGPTGTLAWVFWFELVLPNENILLIDHWYIFIFSFWFQIHEDWSVSQVKNVMQIVPIKTLVHRHIANNTCLVLAWSFL